MDKDVPASYGVDQDEAFTDNTVSPIDGQAN